MNTISQDIKQDKDLEYIQKVIDGDKNAFLYFYKKYGNKLRTHITYLYNKYSKIELPKEELLQDAFIKLYTHINDFIINDNHKYVKEWLHRAATNQAIDEVRKLYSRNKLNMVDVQTIKNNVGNEDNNNVPPYSEFQIADLDSDLLYNDIKKYNEDLLQKNINNIIETKMKYKDLFKQYYINNDNLDNFLGMDEIAIMNNLNPSTLRSRLFRDLNILKKEMKNKKHLLEVY
jgi:RNA polymerase sigma factor (sigma-70 family)